MTYRVFILLLSAVILAGGVTVFVGTTLASSGLGGAVTMPVLITLALGTVVVIRLITKLRAGRQ